jgi:hypothetical protein
MSFTATVNISNLQFLNTFRYRVEYIEEIPYLGVLPDQKY